MIRSPEIKVNESPKWLDEAIGLYQKEIEHIALNADK